MLDACAELIDELGYDGVTTTLIAERAEVAVGSLYQFFPDKRAVVRALTERNLERFMAGVLARLEEAELTEWWDAADVVFDVYVQLFREIRGFSQIRFGDIVDMRLMDDERDNNTVIADRLADLITDRFGVTSDEIRLPLAVAVECADGILNLAFRRKLYDVDTVVAEARKIVRGYLSGKLDQPKDLPSPR
ncbi:TetR family transcriptional regulator [Labedaea rhizosphaerae]|uniref:TetR family transcriptional regulator n=2 Tax=Labedaea rhizosphaerae TaxID=598644 RepID=A0A4R6SLY3_LABRH|nr:TetR/AcrR family transcriptional regulator [Labedaea rhizosphaerae]TDQ05129.1 TetR family transcriptional regulator [Labedaea rhizosphaerae]